MTRPRPIPISSEITILVDFDSACMRVYHSTPAPVLRAAMEEAQRRLWGDGDGAKRFRRLLLSRPLHPEVHIDPGFRIPIWRNVRDQARDAVVAYNKGGFPMKFHAEPEAIDFGAMGPPGPREAAMGGTPPPPPPGMQQTCVHWEWKNGEYVAVYNYTLFPEGGDGPPEARTAAAEAGAVTDESITPPPPRYRSYNIFDRIMPDSGLIAKYQMLVSMKLDFPLEDITSCKEHDRVSKT